MPFQFNIASYPIYLALAGLFWLALAVLIWPTWRATARLLFVLPPSPTQTHLPGLDGLRGLAALYVAVFHAWLWLAPAFNSVGNALPVIVNGFKAVPIFVCLSGFLIYRAVTAATPFDLSRYAARRFRRVYPAYLGASLAFLLTAAWTRPEQLLLVLVSQVFMLPAFGYPVSVNPPAWSLYVEVLFYLVLPVLVFATRRRPMLAAVVATVLMILADNGQSPGLSLARYFGFGIIAAEWYRRRPPTGSLATLITLAGLALVGQDLWFNRDWLIEMLSGPVGGPLPFAGVSPRYSVTLGVGMTLLLAGVPGARWAALILETAPLRALGAVSYSLFLWHAVVLAWELPLRFTPTSIDLAGLPPMPPTWFLPMVLVPAYLTVAALSYLALERPFLRSSAKSGT